MMEKNPIPIIMTLIYIHAMVQSHLEKMPLHRKIFPWPKVGIRDRHRNDPKPRGEKKNVHAFGLSWSLTD